MMKFTPPLPPGYEPPSYEVAYHVLFAVEALLLLLFLVQAWGLYGLAKKQGVQKAWLAWIPGLDLWVLSSLGEKRRYRKSLTALGILVELLPMLLNLGFTVFVLVVNGFALQDIYENWAILLVFIIGGGIMFALQLIPALMLICLRDAVLGDIYELFVPKQVRLYRILSIFQIPIPILIFLCNKKASLAEDAPA